MMGAIEGRNVGGCEDEDDKKDKCRERLLPSPLQVISKPADTV
jgi:hypothetical protein